MKQVSYVLAVILVMAAISSTGCISVPYYVEDHPTANTTIVTEAKIGALTRMPYFVGMSYICTDQGDTLNCKALCGKGTDYKCAGGSIGAQYVGAMPWGNNYHNYGSPGVSRNGSSAAAPAPVAAPAPAPVEEAAGEEVAE